MPTKRGLSADISQRLGTRIVSGEFQAGDSFRLQDVEEEFGVSVTVAREVMHTLQSKGLVEARPRRGISVLERDNWNLLDTDVLDWHRSHLGPIIADLEEARRVIEPWAARAAAESGTREDIAELRAVMEEFRRAAAGGDPSVITAADLEFHRKLLETSGNSVFAQIARVIEPVLRRRDEITMTEDRIVNLDFIPRHDAIVVAIEARDPDAAEQAALDLITVSGQDSKTAFQASA
jgi:GntR family galactonate operon transcriptional repressor